MSDNPFAPGDSPFRSKGNVYRALFESADSRVPGGSAAVLERIDDPALAKFFAQPFLAGSSYDILPLVPFGMAGARILRVAYPEFVRAGAAFTAKRDMSGIYKVLLKLASPGAVVQRLPRILIQYFNFGKIDGRFISEREYEATVSGMPRPLILWLMNVAHGFIPVVLERAGARHIELRIGQGIVEGEQQGIELVRSSFAVSWAEK